MVSVTHTDGSSARVPLADGSDLWYNPGPPNKQYDVNFRPTQMKQRIQDLLQAREWLSSTTQYPNLNAIVDWDKTIVSGFSYGAATTSLLAATKALPSLQAVILLDGWFHVDMMESAGIEFEMPKEAYEATHLKSIPAILINSEQFTKFSKLWKATQKIANQFDSQGHPVVVAKTNHNNFVDLMFWMPTFLIRNVGAIGAADPRQTYVDVVRLTSDFLKSLRNDSTSAGLEKTS